MFYWSTQSAQEYKQGYGFGPKNNQVWDTPWLELKGGIFFVRWLCFCSLYQHQGKVPSGPISISFIFHLIFKNRWGHRYILGWKIGWLSQLLACGAVFGPSGQEGWLHQVGSGLLRTKKDAYPTPCLSQVAGSLAWSKNLSFFDAVKAFHNVLIHLFVLFGVPPAT